jgi:hypothetical protein
MKRLCVVVMILAWTTPVFAKTYTVPMTSTIERRVCKPTRPKLQQHDPKEKSPRVQWVIQRYDKNNKPLEPRVRWISTSCKEVKECEFECEAEEMVSEQ